MDGVLFLRIVSNRFMLVLLTGSSGFLGRYILRNLCSMRCTVKTLSRSSGDYKVQLDEVIPEFNERYELVVHAAGLAHLEASKSNASDIFNKVNVNGTINLLRGLEISGLPKSFVFISSVSVYGQSEGREIDENSELIATDPYGRSKIDSEAIVLDWCRENSIMCTILRLPLIVGMYPPGTLGTMINAIKKGYYFNVTGCNAKKSMVLAEDVAKVILHVSKIGGTYNLTDGYHPSIVELADLIYIQLNLGKPTNIPYWLAKYFGMLGDIFGSKSPINTKKFNKFTSSLTFNDRKAREAFGWNPIPVLEGFKMWY